MSLQTRLTDLIAAIGADHKKLRSLPSYASTSLANLYNTSKSAYNVKASNTRRWRYGLSQARNGIEACELWIGDSIVSGGTNMNTTTFDRLNAIPRQYERALNNLLGVPIAGTGYVPMQDGSVRDSRWVITGFTSQFSCIQSAGSGNTAVFTSNVAGTIVSVLWYDWVGTSFTITVKNSTGTQIATQTVNPANTQVWKKTTITAIAGLNVGSTVTITAGSTSIILAAVEVKVAGAYAVHNAGLAGSQATGSGYLNWGDLSSNYDAIKIWSGYQSQTYATIPAVVHCEPLYYDVQSSATVAAYKTAITTIRNQFPNSDFVLHAQPRPGSSTDVIWFPYLTALYELADTFDCPLLDVEALLGGYSVEAALGMTGDTQAHLNISAYGIWSEATARMII